MRMRASSSIESKPLRTMAREVRVTMKTSSRRSKKRGRTVRFIGKRFLWEQLDLVGAKWENGSMELNDSISDSSFSSEALGMDEEEEESVRSLGRKC